MRPKSLISTEANKSPTYIKEVLNSKLNYSIKYAYVQQCINTFWGLATMNLMQMYIATQ